MCTTIAHNISFHFSFRHFQLSCSLCFGLFLFICMCMCVLWERNVVHFCWIDTMRTAKLSADTHIHKDICYSRIQMVWKCRRIHTIQHNFLLRSMAFTYYCVFCLATHFCMSYRLILFLLLVFFFNWSWIKPIWCGALFSVLFYCWA